MVKGAAYEKLQDVLESPRQLPDSSYFVVKNADFSITIQRGPYDPGAPLFTIYPDGLVEFRRPIESWVWSSPKFKHIAYQYVGVWLYCRGGKRLVLDSACREPVALFEDSLRIKNGYIEAWGELPKRRSHGANSHPWPSFQKPWTLVGREEIGASSWWRPNCINCSKPVVAEKTAGEYCVAKRDIMREPDVHPRTVNLCMSCARKLGVIW